MDPAFPILIVVDNRFELINAADELPSGKPITIFALRSNTAEADRCQRAYILGYTAGRSRPSCCEDDE